MTNAELAILSLIAQQPRHGYKIEQVIEERGMREWTEVGFSSIYYLLNKLETKGFVEARLEKAARGPARKVYRIMPAGERAVYDGAVDALSVPRRFYPQFLLGLAILPRIPRSEALVALRKYRNALKDRLGQVQGSWESQKPLPYFVDAMFDYSVTCVSAEIEWVEKFIRQIEAMED